MIMSQVTDPAPKFSLDIDVQPDATRVYCSGRLMRESGDVLRTEVKKLIAPGKRIILDLTKVTHSDSSGLSAIISIYISSKSAGCRLELINLGEKIRQLLTIANLLSLFESAGDGSFRIP
jgi:anti-anti-sigma factor